VALWVGPDETLEVLQPVAHQLHLSPLLDHRRLSLPGRRGLAGISLCTLTSWSNLLVRWRTSYDIRLSAEVRRGGVLGSSSFWKVILLEGLALKPFL
jgi:hypothetical protein